MKSSVLIIISKVLCYFKLHFPIFIELLEKIEAGNRNARGLPMYIIQPDISIDRQTACSFLFTEWFQKLFGKLFASKGGSRIFFKNDTAFCLNHI